jgi:hypothetical protein
MLAQAEVAEYLNEIRKSVCSRCVERPPGGPPCEPLGKNCGVELHLPELIDSIHHVHSNLLEPYLDHNRKAICEKCAFLHSEICPCPMDYLSALVVEAVERVDQRHVRDSGKFTLPQRLPADLEAIHEAYREGTGTWSGCDWPTTFGKSGLDLQGWHAGEARSMAEQSRGEVAADWTAAARWLTQVEEHARQAEARAAAAVSAASAGHWREALQFAEQAWALEFGSGRAIWHSFPLAWQKLLQATEAAFLTHQEKL